MSKRYDLIIVGMGSAGMTAAEFASTLGLQIAVVERGRIGGDCLWTGCVPSKALIASAKAAHIMRTADRYGIASHDPEIDLDVVWRRIRGIQTSIASTDDDPQRYREMGIDIIHGAAVVTGPNEVTVDGDQVIEGRFILLCTGSRPIEPEIDGLHNIPFITSENLFEFNPPPTSVVMVGGGPIAIEMAQAFVRLGIETTVLQRAATILPRDEPSLVAALTAKLRSEGVALHLNADVVRISSEDGVHQVHTLIGDDEHTFTARGVVVAVGRRPNVDGLGLEDLGIEVGERGVDVDDRGRTAVRTIYAVGDIAGRYLFTHSAGYEGVRAVRDMFFPGKGNVDDFIPWCTFTDPELAHAGLTTSEAEAKFGDDVDIWRIDLTHNDRARADSATDGAIVVVTARGKIVGAHILAPSAGELIHELALAIRNEMKLDEIASLVHVYPTLATSIGQLAAESAYEKAQRYRWLVKRR